MFLHTTLAIMLLGAVVWADGSVVQEARQLEKAVESGKATDEQKTTLAEIYFLTSRCPDVLKLLGKGSENPMACVCGGSCPSTAGPTADVLAFEKALQRKGRWEDAEVQRLWKKVEGRPEARYRALKFLQKSDGTTSGKLRALREQLDSWQENIEGDGA